jgi:hypothetical protein
MNQPFFMYKDLWMLNKSLNGVGMAEATLEVQKHMVNTHETVHGTVIFALADLTNFGRGI